jgi:hypothetical protein
MDRSYINIKVCLKTIESLFGCQFQFGIPAASEKDLKDPLSALMQGGRKGKIRIPFRHPVSEDVLC